MTSKDKITKMIKALYREYFFAKRKLLIMNSMKKYANENKYREVLIPIVDALASSIVINLSNIYSIRKDTVNINRLIDEIITCSDKENIDYYNKLKLEVTMGKEKEDPIRKLALNRGNMYGHLSIKNVIDEQFDDNDKIKISDIEYLINTAEKVLNGIYRVFFKTDIIYTDKDDAVVRLQLKKIEEMINKV